MKDDVSALVNIQRERISLRRHRVVVVRAPSMTFPRLGLEHLSDSKSPGGLHVIGFSDPVGSTA